MKLVKRFLTTSAVYLFGKIATYVVTFAMLRYYTHHIAPEAYGDYEYIYSLINVVIPALFIELWSGVLRFTLGAEEKDRDKVLSTVAVMLIPTLIAYTLVYCGVSAWLQWEKSVLIYIFAVTFLLVNIMMMVSRAFSKNVLFAASGIIGGLINAAVGVFCVRVLQLQIEAMMLAMIGNYTVQILILAVGTKIWRYVRFKNANKELAVAMIRYCLPFLPNTILYYINTNYYMTLVRSILGRDVLGLYTVSTKFCVVVTFVVSVFHLAWQEITYSVSKDQEKYGIYTMGLNVFMDISMVGTLVLLPLVKLVFPFFIGAEYSASSAYVPAYYSTVFFTSLSGFLYNTLAAENITVYHPITKLISASVNLLLMYSLIDTIGVYAVIAGAVASAAIEVVVLTVVIRKKIGLKFRLQKILLFIACYLCGCVIYNRFGMVVNAAYMIMVLMIGLGYFLVSNRSLVRSALGMLRKSS